MSAGLGGGSLIYANVFIRKDPKWFVRENVPGDGYESWPLTREDLDPYYDRVEKMIGFQKYPFDHSPYAGTPKTLAMRAAADGLKQTRPGQIDWYLPDLAVTFGNPGDKPVPGASIVEPDGNPAWTATNHVSFVLRVQHRMQLRQQEHARLHLPQRGQAARSAAARAHRGATVSATQ